MNSSSQAVFLSYASQDTQAAARIAQALRNAGVEVWFDRSELVGGDAWDHKIRQQIKSCALFIPIVSGNTQARSEGYFRLEWRLADQRTHLMGRNKAFLMPVCVDDTPEQDADVPDSFFAAQWTRLPGGETPTHIAAHIKQLIASRPRDHEPGLGSKSSPAAVAPAVSKVADHSVAVLAFANLSNDPENEFFSDGLSEELINVLAQVPGLKVTARTSAFHFKGKSTPVPEIARQLGVAHVVEGSVRKAGDRVRITAQLIKAADGFHAWSETFTRELTDIFEVQDEIAGLIADNLSLKLSPSARRTRKVDPAAYRLYLEGRSILHREVPEDYPKGIALLERSLEIDPQSAQTWSCLSTVHLMAANTSSAGGESLRKSRERARLAAEKAIKAEPDAPQGHTALAFCLMFNEWDWALALNSLNRALELAPGDAESIGLLSMLKGIWHGAQESVDLARQAVDLDPLNYLTSYTLMRSLMYVGDYAGVEKQARRLISLNPSGLRSKMFLCLALLQQDRIEEAATTADHLPAGWGERTYKAIVRFAQDRKAESDEILAQMKVQDQAYASYQIAHVHAYRGEIDEAFAWLERGIETRDSGIPLAKTDPLLQNLHDDPRWDPFLRRLGLADDQLP